MRDIQTKHIPYVRPELEHLCYSVIPIKHEVAPMLSNQERLFLIWSEDKPLLLRRAVCYLLRTRLKSFVLRWLVGTL